MKATGRSSNTLQPTSVGGGDINFEAEHRPDVSRRASNTAIRRFIQKSERGLTPPTVEGTQAAAAHGIASPTTALPFADQIQASFGPAHEVSKIQAHVGGDSASAMGASAFASGNHVVFDRAPDLHTAAHEAAHVVQQARGVNLYGGVGHAGDDYERHADAVADRVVAGRSATDLLGAVSGGSSTAAIQKDEKNAAIGGQGPYLRPPNVGTAPSQRFVKTGDPIADAGSCNFDDGAGCFLSPAQRVQVVTAFCTHIQDVRNIFFSAISDLRMEKLVESDAETSIIGSIVGIVFGIVTGWMGAALATAMKAAASNAKTALAAASLFDQTKDLMLGSSLVAPELPGKLATALTHVSPGAIDATTKGLGSVLSSQVMATLAAGAVDGDSKRVQKGEAVAYVDEIAQSTSDFYVAYRNAMLQNNDATLITLCKAFSDPPKIADVKAMLSAKVEHYMSSNVPKIGRQVRNADRPVSSMGKPLMEMRVAWVVDTFSKSKRLAYFDRAFANPTDYNMRASILKVHDDKGRAMPASDWLERGFYGGDGSPAFSLADPPQHTEQTMPGPAKTTAEPAYPTLEDGDHLVGFVEDDLVELALQHHDRAWMKSPETYYFNPATQKLTKDRP